MDGVARNKLMSIGAGIVVLVAFGALLYKTGMFALAPNPGATTKTGASAPASGQAQQKVAAATPAAAPSSPANPAAGTPAQTTAAPSSPATAKPSTSPAKPSAPAAANAPAFVVPSFDIVRVEPSGEAVVAGRAQPGARVTLMNSGKPAGVATADTGGQFVILPKALPPGAHNLSLSIEGPGGQISRQSVAVAVPATPAGEVMVALAEPDKPTIVLSQKPADQSQKPGGASAAAPANPAVPASPSAPQIARADAPVLQPAARQAPAVKFNTVEADEAGGFLASGQAAPGAQLRVYLNNIFIAEVRAGPDGKWSLKVNRGLTTGDYAVRADVVDPAGKVSARAEVPFAMAAGAAAPSASSQATAASPQTIAASPQTPAASLAAKSAPPAASAGAAPAAGSAGHVGSKGAGSNAAPAAQTLTGQPAVTVARQVPAPQTATGGQPERVAAAASGASAAATPQPSPPSAGPGIASAAADPAAAHVVIEQIRTANVVRGDSLWRISRKMLGQGIRYTQIYQANSAQIRNPNRIYPGQVLVVPRQGAQQGG